MMEFRVLGPLEVRTPQGPVALGGRHFPKMLAVLLNEANRIVPVDRLVDVLWEDDLPATAARQVQNKAAALRHLLGPAGARLKKVGTGYRFDAEVDELDVLRCERSASEARRHRTEGRPAEAEQALDEALAEWRGPSLIGLSGNRIEQYARRLDEYRLTLTEERIDLGLSLGRHETLLGELRRLHVEHPYRERFAEHLMLALHRNGRASEALRVYAELADRLADELGADPGKPLRDLHTAILREDQELELDAPQPTASTVPTAPSAPVTLPASTAAFTGRDAALADLDESADSQGNPLVILTGVGGVGKTMLALHWASGAADRFPGGRLYLDLRGFAAPGSAIEPDEAIRQLLGALGVEPRRIPADTDAQTALYRDVIGSERRLLILDNARDADQVRQLLPNSPQVHTVVISRRRLVGLAVSRGARIIGLESFTSTEAATLFERQIGTRRLAPEPEAVQRILTACAGLPLALAIAAARAAARPSHPMGAIADELETHRLDALAGDEDTADLRTVFSWSYRFLEPDAARLFRLLSVIPGPDFGFNAAVELDGGPAEEAARNFRRLIDAHLVECGRPGRFRLHDLLRVYAAELLEAEDPKPDREAAVARLLDWYLDTADTCRSFLYPGEAGLPASDTPVSEHITTAAEAADWLKVEWGGLVAAVEHAAEHGHTETAWRLADALRGYIWNGMIGSDGLRVGRAALAAASSIGDPLGIAAIELCMACAFIRTNRLLEAVRHGRNAADLARYSGWIAGAAAAEFNLGVAAFYRGRMREGILNMNAALNDNREIGERQAECSNLHWLGILHSAIGELETGMEYFHQALVVANETGVVSAKSVLLTHMAEGEIFLGRFDLAAERLDEAAELERSGPGYDKSCDIQGANARLQLARGEIESALQNAREVTETRTDAADYRIRTSAMVTLASAYRETGAHDEAIAHYDTALAMTEREATSLHRVEALVGRAATLARGIDADSAKTAALQALEATQAGEYRFLEAQALNVLAEIDLSTGHLGEAAESAHRALTLCRETGHRPGEMVSLRLIAAITRIEPSHAGKAALHGSAVH